MCMRLLSHLILYLVITELVIQPKLWSRAWLSPCHYPVAAFLPYRDLLWWMGANCTTRDGFLECSKSWWKTFSCFSFICNLLLSWSFYVKIRLSYRLHKIRWKVFLYNYHNITHLWIGRTFKIMYKCLNGQIPDDCIRACFHFHMFHVGLNLFPCLFVEFLTEENWQRCSSHSQTLGGGTLPCHNGSAECF